MYKYTLTTSLMIFVGFQIRLALGEQKRISLLKGFRLMNQGAREGGDGER